jgi:hypothetical protein
MLLELVLLPLHLLFVNLAAAGPIGCMLMEWGESRGQLECGRAGRQLAAASIVALLLGAASGLLLGWVRWDAQSSELYGRLGRKLVFGGIELLFSLSLMLAYWRWWRSETSPGRSWRLLLLLLAGTNLLYHFPPLFAVLTHLRETGQAVGEPITATEFRSLVMLPEVLALFLHIVLAALATTGVYLIWQAQRDQANQPSSAAMWGARLALAATILQLPAGLWLTVAVSKTVQQNMMGGDPWATLAFLASLLGALSLMHHLAAVSFRVDAYGSRRSAVLLLIVVVTLMSVSLQLSTG